MVMHGLLQVGWQSAVDVVEQEIELSAACERRAFTKLWTEQFRHDGPGPMQPLPHQGIGNSQLFGRLTGTELFHIAKKKHKFITMRCSQV